MFLTWFGQRTMSHNISSYVTVYIEKENQKEQVEIQGWARLSSSFWGPGGQVASETGWVGTRWADRENTLEHRGQGGNRHMGIWVQNTAADCKWMGRRCGGLMDETWTGRWADGTSQRGMKARLTSVGGKRAGPSPGQIHYGVSCFVLPDAQLQESKIVTILSEDFLGFSEMKSGPNAGWSWHISIPAEHI